MKSPLRLPTPVWGLFLLLATLGGLGFSALRMRREQDRLNRLQMQHQALLGLHASSAGTKAELEAFAGGSLTDLAELLAAYLPGLDVESEAGITGDFAGFRLRSGGVRVREVPWEQLSRFVLIAETQSPPWRLTRIELRAGLAGLEGELTFQGLERGGE